MRPHDPPSPPARVAPTLDPPVAPGRRPSAPNTPTLAAPLAPDAGPAPGTSLSGSVALVQGRLIELLTDMLKRGATVPVRDATPPPPLASYTGPDAALLQLQRDAIALALEALSAPPPAPSKPQPR
jgi:hypothetical protein